MAKTIWSGRFKKGLHPLTKAYSYSLDVDIALLEAEVTVDIAWAKMLARGKLITPSEARKLERALKAIVREVAAERGQAAKLIKWIEEYEDVHSFVQAQLEKKVGVLGKKIHTGRSRNDLVVTSTRLYLSDQLDFLEASIQSLQAALVKQAERNTETLMSGVTHLRRAQPISLGHHFLAYVEMLEEDSARLHDARERLDVLPLGSAALAGAALKIDQKFLARELGFSKIANNSLKEVSDRAFMTEIMSHIALVWMHLSRLSEDFILWNSEPFGYVELDDAFATGSSLMPQKKNPDVFELTRGRAGGAFAALQAHLVMQKGLPLSYNRDLQEDKPQVFEWLFETIQALELLALTVKTAKFHKKNLAASVQDDVLYATDLLDYLVRKGTPFSEAHHTVGKIVALAESRKVSMSELPLKDYQSFSKAFEKNVFKLFDPAASVSAKRTIGSTHPERVDAEVKRWKKLLKLT